MTTFARVPVIPGPVLEVFVGSELFPMFPAIAATWYVAPNGTQQNYTYNGATFSPPAAPPPLTSAQEAALALTQGLTITCTSVSALNGTYDVSAASQLNLNATATYVILNNTFPLSQETMPWYDMTGTAHIIPSTTIFNEFATAIANYVAAVTFYGASGQGSLPPNSVTIA